jgi:hypothetical protein
MKYLNGKKHLLQKAKNEKKLLHIARFTLLLDIFEIEKEFMLVDAKMSL